MLTRKRFLKLFILFVIVGMLVSACDRPLPGSDNTNTGGNDNSYPGPAQTDNSAVEEGETGETNTDAEPTREVMEETEAGEEVAETESEAAEGDTETAGEETPAESETPAEEGAETGGGESGEPPAGEAESSGSETGSEETGEAAETEEPAVTEEGAETAEAAAEEAEVEATEATVVQTLPTTHTVAAGENLYRIGLKYGISWVVIARANGITNEDRIFAGQVLTIPSGDSGTGGQPGPMPTPEGINYVVKPGDTLFKIAQQFNISWVEIAEANGLVNPNEIYAGQMIKIPVDAPTPPPVVNHVVKQGETLYRIALQYGLSWLVLAKANHLEAPYIIYAGQTLVIPGG